MTSKTQLQSKIQELEVQLKEFKSQLNNYKEVTLETAFPGDILEDGSIVVDKQGSMALLVAPASTEVYCEWSKEFSEVFDALKSQGFNHSQWFVPTKAQLQLAYKTIPEHFSSTFYWSSTEYSATNACNVTFDNGNTFYSNKTTARGVRAFRCVTY